MGYFLSLAASAKRLRVREVAMKVTCRKCGWSREGLTQGSILTVMEMTEDDD